MLAGCITRPAEGLPEIEPEYGGTQPRLEHRVGAFRLLDAEGNAAESPASGRDLADAILDRWRDRGLIATHADVASAGFSGTADLDLVWNGVRSQRSRAWQRIASLATLGLLPYSIDTTFDVDVVARNARTGERFEAAVSHGYRTTFDLLLVFALPFAPAGENRALDTLADHLFEQLRAKGAFDRAPRDTAYARAEAR